MAKRRLLPDEPSLTVSRIVCVLQEAGQVYIVYLRRISNDQ